jgi:predicted outer membrane repeat protein
VGSFQLQGITFSDGSTPVIQSAFKISTLTIDSCTFRYYRTTRALEIGPITTIKNSLFDANAAGALLANGTLTATNTRFTNNLAQTDGAAIYMTGSGNFMDCEFMSNKASSGSGGAIMQANESAAESFVVRGCKFDSNVAPLLGGALSAQGTVVVDSTHFVRNSATLGGAIGAAKANVNGAVFDANEAGEKGGAVYVMEASIESTIMENNKVLHNEGQGGALWISTNYMMTNNTFTSNTVPGIGAGGAVFGPVGQFLSVTFDSNSAYDGGAVQVSPDSRFENCTFTANTATHYGGAVYKPLVGPLSIVASTSDGNTAVQGGAVYAPLGMTSVAASKFTNNSAIKAYSWLTQAAAWDPNTFNASSFGPEGMGGALFVQDADLRAATFMDNTATIAGGAVYATRAMVMDGQYQGNTAFSGGAIYVTDHVNITGPTLAENKATGLVGGAVVTPTLPVLTSTTFSKNEAAEMGGAIHCMDAVDLIGNNFTGNKASMGGAIYTPMSCSFTGSIFKENSAVGSTYTQGDGGAVHCTPTIQLMSTIFIGNTAANNGGAIMTQVLQSAQDKFEYNSAQAGGGAAFVTSTLSASLSAFTGNSAHRNGGALYFDQVNDTVHQPNHTNVTSIYVVNTTWTIDGCIFTLNKCDQLGGAIYSVGPVMSYSNHYNNNTGVKGGAVYASGDAATLLLHRDHFFGNRAVGGAYSATPNGGAVMTEAVANVTECAFTANTALKAGGALFHMQNLTVFGSQFISNVAAESGGAIAGEIPGSELLELQQCMFQKNTATLYDGGAVYAAAAVTSMAHIFTSNTAGRSGGAVYSPGPVHVAEGQFTHNAAAHGGAVYASAELVSRDNYFTSNTVSGNGGALWAKQSLMLVPPSRFEHNTAGQYGGAVYGATDTILQVDKAEFLSNAAKYGGGVFSDDVTTTNVVNSVFDRNTASIRGPALYQLDKLTTSNTSFSLNTCPLDPNVYMNVWFEPNARRSVGTLYVHWIVHPGLAVGNQLQLQLPPDIELHQCNEYYPNDGCNTTVWLDGAFPQTPDYMWADPKTNLVTIQWERNGILNMTQKDVYVIHLDNVRAPNHCENLTYSISTRHCRLHDVLGAGKVFRRVCEAADDDYVYTTTFMTSELTGTPKGCNVCNACYKSEWNGFWRCHHGSAGFFSRSTLEQSCAATT